MLLSKKVKSIQENVERSSGVFLIFNDIIWTWNFLFTQYIAWKKDLWIKWYYIKQAKHQFYIHAHKINIRVQEVIKIDDKKSNCNKIELTHEEMQYLHKLFPLFSYNHYSSLSK